MRSLIVATLLSSLTAACGAQTNILGRTVPAEHLDSFGNLLSTARAAYDRGDLEKARTLAKRAYDLDSDSEEASVLYGFINLSLAGGDPFKLAEAMIAKEKAKNEGEDDGGSTTADTLGALKAVIGLSDSEFALMGTLDRTDPDLPIMIPRCAEDARALVQKLSYLNDAIVAVCPFVDAESRLTIDYRQNCPLHEGERHQRPRAHFLWAFAHLTEALAFNSVLTYGTVDPKKTNLELRVEKIRALDTTTAGVAPLLTAVESLNATLNAVLPTSGKCSETAPTTQLRATLSDMLAVDAAFAVIPGTPDRIKTSIQKVMARIKEVQAGGGSTTEAMKGDFTKKMSRSLADKLDTVGNDPAHPLSPAQKDALCGSYGTIAAGSGQASALCATP